MRVDGTFGAGCECPPFSAWFSDPGESFSPIFAIPKNGAADIRMRLNLRFILVGYFSGALVNTYDYYRAVGVEPGEPDEEERSAWEETYPEFCLEALCYAVPAFRRSASDTADAEYVTFLRGVSAKHAAELSRLGVPECKPAWIREP